MFKFVKLTPTSIYKCLLFKDPFNYVGMAQTYENESEVEYRMEIEHVLNKQEGKYLKLLLITFVQKISLIKDEL